MALPLEVTCAIMRKVELEYGDRLGARFLDLDGPCSFLTCLEEGPHRHAICPKCGAVKFGNISCPTCREVNQAAREELALEKMRAKKEVEGGDD